MPLPVTALCPFSSTARESPEPATRRANDGRLRCVRKMRRDSGLGCLVGLGWKDSVGLNTCVLWRVVTGLRLLRSPRAEAGAGAEAEKPKAEAGEWGVTLSPSPSLLSCSPLPSSTRASRVSRLCGRTPHAHAARAHRSRSRRRRRRRCSRRSGSCCAAAKGRHHSNSATTGSYDKLLTGSLTGSLTACPRTARRQVRQAPRPC
jgi:hypothetical protein